MTTIRSFILLTLAVALTIGGGMLQGSYNRRWGTSEQEAVLGQRLQSVPAQFAGWTLKDEYEIGNVVEQLLKPSGYLNRSYVAANGEQVNVAVILGAHGPISVHTPEVCYDSRDYTQLGERKAVTVKDGAGNETKFWTLTFKSNGVEQSGLRVYYAWSPKAEWEAVESPRMAYFGQPYLFKIQLACATDPENSDADNDTCHRFLADFVPVLKQQLFNES